MNASEARRVATWFLEDWFLTEHFQKEAEPVLSAIKEAAERGKYGISYSTRLPSNVKAFLSMKGYKLKIVQVGTSHLSPVTDIEW